MKMIILISAIMLSLLIGCGKDKSTNPQSTIIDTVLIGNQVWMVKNLDVDHYRNGDPIPQITDQTTWENLTTGAWCYYNNDSALGDVYGKLYNWYAVNDPRGLAPTGWHIPSDQEWRDLANYLSGAGIAGGELKEIGISHWNAPNAGGTNLFDFNALPGGWRADAFYGIGTNGDWWTSTLFNSSAAWFRIIVFDDFNLRIDNGFNFNKGFSVRCVKDK